MIDHDAPEKIMWEGDYIVAKTRGRWEYVGRPRNIRAAVILAVEQGHVLLVEQYRVPLGKRCIELPAGLIGDQGQDEEALDAAGRELEEETGWRAERLEDMGEYCSSPGMVSESFTLVRAHGLTQIDEGGGVDEEDIVPHRVAIDRLPAFLAAKRAEGCAIDVRVMGLLMGGWLA